MGWFNLAVCLERMGDWEEASEAFRKTCDLESNNLDAHLGMGVCRLRLEDPKSALFAFEHCLELAPDHEDGLFGKAAALQALGHSDEAAELYEKILARNSESEESLANLVLIGMSKDDFDMVREFSERLLALKPESTVASKAWQRGPARRTSILSRQSSALCWSRWCRHISRAGSISRWHIKSPGCGNRPPKRTKKL
jgi:tetratricopeptide (TPR) repeat protein